MSTYQMNYYLFRENNMWLSLFSLASTSYINDEMNILSAPLARYRDQIYSSLHGQQKS